MTHAGSQAPLIDEAALLSIAQRVATHNGDPSPTSVRWVYGPYSRLADAQGFGIGDKPDTTRILVILEGVFLSPSKRGPRGASEQARTHRGRFIGIIVDPVTATVTDFSIGDQPIDLESVGEVHTA